MILRLLARRHGVALRVCAGLACASATPATALAQRVTGPFAGLFGADARGENAQSLDFRAAFGTAYDSNLNTTPSALDPFVSPDQQMRLSQGVSAGLSYERQGDRLQLLLGGGTALRQYVGTQSFFAPAYQLGTTMNARLGSKVSMDASGGAAVVPFFQFAPVFATAIAPGVAAGPADALGRNDPYALVSQKNHTLTGAVGVTNQYSKSSSLTASLSWRTTRFPGSEDLKLDGWGARGGIVHRLSRSLSMRLGYGREEIHYDLVSQAPMINEVIDVGVDYGTGLSLSRRTSFSFSTKTSILRQSAGNTFRLNGDAQVSRGFARTWSAQLAYARSTDFVAGFTGPLFSDAVTASFGGLIAPRAQWSSTVGASRGEVGSGEGRTFVTYTGNTTLTVGMTRRLGAYGQYGYTHYELPTDLTAFALRPQLARHTASAGISMWLPLAAQTRGPRDPR